ncbi:MAG: tyrosine-type recombinase/integrase [Candidatus Bathyarchaeota archaeon]
MMQRLESGQRCQVSSDAELIEGFRRDCELRRLSPETIRGYIPNLRAVSRLMESKGLSIGRLDKNALTEILKYLVDRGYVYNTLVQYFSALSGFCDYLVWKGVTQANPVTSFRKRYIRQYKDQHNPERKLISVEEIAMLVNSILDPRGKALVTLLAKTGIRRGELIRIDLADIDWVEQSIMLKPHPKRSNCTVFFDDECARILRRWIKAREGYGVEPACKALFVNEKRGRLERHGVDDAVTKPATRVGLHNPKSKRIEDHFTPHCCRHWFTTHLRRNGMRRELIQELRGDTRRAAIDIYDHIDKKELKRAYLATIPVLGIG